MPLYPDDLWRLSIHEHIGAPKQSRPAECVELVGPERRDEDFGGCQAVEMALLNLLPMRLDDVSNPDFDVFIAFGTGYWPDMKVELLVEVEFTPLCSPVLINKSVSLSDPSDIGKACLLHLVDHEDWESWLTLANVDPAFAQTGITFSDMNLVYSAAMSGQGIAMGDEFICRGAMASGHLVRPFDVNIKSKRSYYLVVSEAKADNKTVMAFSDWLKEEVMKNEAAAVLA